VLASRNQGKLAELRRLLGQLPWALVSVDESPAGQAVRWDENGASYRENAAIKAWAVSAGTGLAALADDSGLELDAFGGWPGLHTARWMGDGFSAEEMMRALAERVATLPEDNRGATFRCVLAYLAAGRGGDRQPLFVEGVVRGTLLGSPRGNGGFGYDPIFVPDGHTETMAELAEAEKDSVSHRGRAAQALVRRLIPPPS
jgi:XTP/dITP diphosphohydrolase